MLPSLYHPVVFGMGSPRALEQWLQYECLGIFFPVADRGKRSGKEGCVDPCGGRRVFVRYCCVVHFKPNAYLCFYACVCRLYATKSARESAPIMVVPPTQLIPIGGSMRHSQPTVYVCVLF